MDMREQLLSLLVRRSLKLGDFTLASGARSTYYVDARRTTMTAEGQFLVGSVCLELFEKEGLSPSHVGGLTLGADPVTYSIAHASWSTGAPIDGFTVRKRAKAHGTAQRIEGGLPDDAEVVVIEDSITSGGSVIEAVAAVEEHGAEVLGVLTLVDREQGGMERLAAAGHRLFSVFLAAELLDWAEDMSAHP